MSDYWHRAYICPFWAAAGKKTIKCEDGCMLCFPGELRHGRVHQPVLRKL